MELKDFVKKLYELRKEIGLYNLALMNARVSKLDIPKGTSMDDFEKFCIMAECKMKYQEEADEHKLSIRLKAQEMLDDLFEAGLTRTDDIYELIELSKLERS